MKIAYFWLTSQGKQLAEIIKEKFDGDIKPKENFKQNVYYDFYVYDALVFIMATGIVVRTIAPLIKSKTSDPAIVVLDQQGKNVISLMSGHLGGANELTRKIAYAIGANPVITTATDVQNVPAFDEIAKRNNLIIENIDVLKHISSDLLEGKTIELYTDLSLLNKDSLPHVKITFELSKSCRVIISDKILFNSFDCIESKILYLRPKSIVIGVGCKKNTETQHLKNCFYKFLETYKLSPISVIKIATIGLKQHEPAILALCESLGIQLEIVPDEDIKNCAYPFESSEFVRSVTGLPSVSEACSYLASDCGEVITGKVKYSGVTLSACRIKLPPLKLKE